MRGGRREVRGAESKDIESKDNMTEDCHSVLEARKNGPRARYFLKY